jgi:hypothetical protein
MGWRAGAEFNMMEKSCMAQFSAAGRSFPPYAAGNNHNTWYPASLLDAAGREIPYADHDGRLLENVMDRFYPAGNQAFFMKGGNIEQAKYPYEGPETLPYERLREQGYKLPFYAWLGDLPRQEREVIWGMMVGQEAKTNVPVHRYYSERGFDPARDVLQCYGNGWKSGEFLPQERQLFGMPGGFMNDWQLMTSLPGLFAAGDALFASNCYGHAACTGHYAGRHAAAWAAGREAPEPEAAQIAAERERVYAPLLRRDSGGYSWKEVNHAVAKAMQNYCGMVKEDLLLKTGIEVLEGYRQEVLPRTAAANPHELMRLLEVFDILTVAEIILHACISRTSDCEKLEFYRSDNRGLKDEPFIVLRQEKGKVIARRVPLDFAGEAAAQYEKYNREYVGEKRHG